MSEECKLQSYPLFNFACDYRELSTAQVQADTLSPGIGAADRLLLRLQNLNVPREAREQSVDAVRLGIDTLNQRIERARRDINQPGLPFQERMHLHEQLQQSLEHIKSDTANRLFEIAMDNLLDCARKDRSWSK